MPGMMRPGMLQRSSWKISGSASSASETSNTRSTSTGLATRCGRAATVASTGMISDPDTMVSTGWIHPTRSTRPGSRATSSYASRSAAADGSSSPSRRPPGKLTSPLCVRRADDRRVRRSRVSPCASHMTARTPAFTWRTAGALDSLTRMAGPSTRSDPMPPGTGPRWPTVSSASSTRSRPIPRARATPGRPPRAQDLPAATWAGGGSLGAGRAGASASRYRRGNAHGSHCGVPRPRYALAP